MTIGRPLLALAVVLTAAAPVGAQEWTGSNGFQVVVTDDAGQSLPGVTVMVFLAEPDRLGGPPPLLTDASGVAEVSGLSAGEWQVELRREGFMIVSSYLRLEDGKRPQVGFTSRQRTGPFWAPMNVGYSSLGIDTSAVSAGSARAMTRAQRRAERRAEQRARRQRSENMARVVEPPPEPPEAPAAQPVAVAERLASEPPVEKRPAAAAPKPEPESEPEPAVVRLLPNRTLLRAGACPECGPGEWSVASNWPAEPRTAETVACAPDLAARMERVAKAVEVSLPVDFRVYAGSLAEPTGNDVLRLLPEEVRAEVQELLLPILDPERSCQVLGIFLPEGARFVGFQYEAADLERRGGCLPEQPCEIGEAAWRGNPVIHSHQRGTFVYGVFENLSPERRREANFKVYFGPPRGWLPPR